MKKLRFILTISAFLLGVAYAAEKIVVVDDSLPMPWETIANPSDLTSLNLTNITIRGSATTGAMWIATNTLGQGTLTKARAKLKVAMSQTTNSSDLIVSGVGFRPNNCVVFGGLENKKAITFGIVDSSGGEYCIIRRDEDAISYSGTASAIYDTAAKRCFLQLKSFDADGITFYRRPDAGIITNNVVYLFEFYQ